MAFVSILATPLLYIVVAVQAFGIDSVHALAPPAAAILGGAILVWPSLRETIRDPERFGKALVLCVMPQTSLIFALVAAILLLQPEAPPLSSLWPLWLVGGTGAIAIVVQAIMLRAGLPAVTGQEKFGRFLVPYSMPSALTFAAFVVAFVAGRP